MAKKTGAAPDMSKYVSRRTPKGVRYLQGKDKASFIKRMKRAFSKAKVPA